MYLSSPVQLSPYPPRSRAVPMSTMLRLLVLLAIAATLSACGVNPVTGESEIQFISEKQEIALGEKNYLFTQQSQGGDYAVDPELSRYVNEVGQRLVKVSDRPHLPYEFVVLNNSVPNAWALPGGKIALNRGLLVELKNEAELAAVLGHEIVHAAARHGAKRMERGMLLNIGVASVGLAAAGGRHAEHADLITGAAAVGANLISSKYGRAAELQSDHYGMRYMSKAGYDPRAAVSLQQTFVRLSEGRSAGWLEGLFASHPPSQDRVEENARFAKQLPQGGDLGEARYQARVAHLLKTRPAYALYEKGRKALGEQRPAEALGYAEQAIAIEPRESLFYALQGDVLFQQGRIQDAEGKYSQALQHNQRFFYYHRQRGLAKHQRRDFTGARRDLQQSLQLLPTASAHHALGNIALHFNQADLAKKHLQAAASSEAPAGRAAFQQLALLELAQAPHKYLSAKPARTRDGYLAVEVRNRTAHPVGNIVVRVQVVDRKQRIVLQEFVRIYGNIAANQSRAQQTKIQIAQFNDRHGISAKVMEAQVLK